MNIMTLSSTSENRPVPFSNLLQAILLHATPYHFLPPSGVAKEAEALPLAIKFNQKQAE